MHIAEFNILIDNAIREERYLEAFILKSLYIESIITVLATAKRFHEKGFDGATLSVAIEIEKDTVSKKIFEKSMQDKLSENIYILRGAPFLKERPADCDYLYTWKDKYRDEIFHNLGELILKGNLKHLAQEGLEFTRRFTEQEWFKKMEESFKETEQKIQNI